MASPFLPTPRGGYEDTAEAPPPREQPRAPQGPDVGDLGQKWQSWIDKPANKAALMQFGIAMMQPTPIGQSSMGQLGNSIAEAGGAIRQVEANEAEDTVNRTNAALTTARAGAATERAGAAEARARAAEAQAGAAGTRADTARILAENRGELTAKDRLTAAAQLQKQYSDRKAMGYPGSYQDYLNSDEVDPGLRDAAQGGNAVRPTRATTAGTKPSTRDVQTDARTADAWKAAQRLAKSPNPGDKQKAVDIAARLARSVSDPDNVYLGLGLEPPR